MVKKRKSGSKKLRASITNDVKIDPTGSKVQKFRRKYNYGFGIVIVALVFALVANTQYSFFTPFTSVPKTEDREHTVRKPLVIAYAPEYSGVKADGSLSFDFISRDIIGSMVTKAKSAGIKRVFVSIGGGGRSKGFANVVRDQFLKKTFINELVSLCDKYALDGIDLDWEAPSSPKDLEFYSLLLEHAKQSFASKGYILTVALHVGQDLGARAYEHVDRIHLMTYDMRAGMHSTVADTRRAAALMLDYGIPSDRLIIGIPCYGRSMDDFHKVKTFSEIVNEKKTESARREAAEEEISGSFYYNGRTNVHKKAKLAAAMGLGGIFLWEAGQDVFEDSLSLMQAASQAFGI